MKNIKGFMFIELIMVMVIIAIIAAVMMNPKGDVLEIRTAQAAYKIKSDIRYAQSYALSSQKRTRISFDPDAESYSVYAEESPENWVLIKNPLTKIDFTVDFTEDKYSGTDIVGTNFDGSDVDLLFDAAGNPYSYDQTPGTAVELSSQGMVTLGGSVTVTVEPRTGKVSIE